MGNLKLEIKNIMLENYKAENTYLSDAEITKQIYGNGDLPKKAKAELLKSVKNAWGFVRNELELAGYLVVPHFKKGNKKTYQGRKLARIADIESVEDEIRLRMRRREGHAKAVTRGLKAAKTSKLLPAEKIKKLKE